jgi:hypothetical protein
MAVRIMLLHLTEDTLYGRRNSVYSSSRRVCQDGMRGETSDATGKYEVHHGLPDRQKTIPKLMFPLSDTCFLPLICET